MAIPCSIASAMVRIILFNALPIPGHCAISSVEPGGKGDWKQSSMDLGADVMALLSLGSASCSGLRGGIQDGIQA